jgi:hypothetical protein
MLEVLSMLEDYEGELKGVYGKRKRGSECLDINGKLSKDVKDRVIEEAREHDFKEWSDLELGEYLIKLRF